MCDLTQLPPIMYAPNGQRVRVVKSRQRQQQQDPEPPNDDDLSSWEEVEPVVPQDFAAGSPLMGHVDSILGQIVNVQQHLEDTPNDRHGTLDLDYLSSLKESLQRFQHSLMNFRQSMGPRTRHATEGPLGDASSRQRVEEEGEAVVTINKRVEVERRKASDLNRIVRRKKRNSEIVENEVTTTFKRVVTPLDLRDRLLPGKAQKIVCGSELGEECSGQDVDRRVQVKPCLVKLYRRDHQDVMLNGKKIVHIFN